MKTILITAANGMFGSKTAEILARMPDINLKLMLRDAGKNKITGPHVEICPADLDSMDSMDPYFTGVDSLFLVTPMDPRLNTRESAIVELCKKHGVRQIVKIHGAVKHNADKLDQLHQGVLSQVKSSGIEWVLISPNSVMETSLLSYRETIQKARAIISCAGDGKIGLVALNDVAHAIAHVLTTDGHGGKNYELTGPASLTLTEVAETFTRVIGKEIVYIDLSEKDFSEMIFKYEKSMTPDRLEMEILCHLRAWKRGGADLVTQTYKQLTGEDPTSLETFIRDRLNFFRKGIWPGFIVNSVRKSMLKK